jgi:hypothetical protein
VSFLFGARRPREDPELAAGERRRQEAFARDIGDEHALAWSRARPVGVRRRRRWTPAVFVGLVLFATLGAIPLLRAGSAGGLVRRQCDQPVIGLSAGRTQPGHEASWQVAGPRDVMYVLTLDADRVTVSGSGGVAATPGRILAGPFDLPDCRSTQTLFAAPTEPGDHLVTLFRRTADGYQAVARTTLKVR